MSTRSWPWVGVICASLIALVDVATERPSLIALLSLGPLVASFAPSFPATGLVAAYSLALCLVLGAVDVTLGTVDHAVPSSLVLASGALALVMSVKGERGERSISNAKVAAWEAARTRDRMASLDRIGKALSASLDTQRTLVELARSAVPWFADGCLVVCELDGERHSAVAGWDAMTSSQGEAAEAAVWEVDGEARIVDDRAADDVLKDVLKELGAASTVVMPILAPNARGVAIFAMTESGRSYEDGDVSYAAELVGRAVDALENARLYRAEASLRLRAQEASDRIGRLEAVTVALSDTVDPREIAEAVVAEAVLATDSGAGVVATAARDGALAVLAEAGDTRDLVHPENQPSLTDVLRTGAPVVIPDGTVSNGPREAGSPGCLAAVPLEAHGRVTGALAVARAWAFETDDVSFLAALGRHCGQAIERARLFESEQRARERAERERERESFIAGATELLAQPLDASTRLRELARLLVPRFADWAVAVLVNESGSIGELEIVHHDVTVAALARESANAEPPELEDGAGFGKVLRTGRTEFYPTVTEDLLDSDLAGWAELGQLDRPDLVSGMIVPLPARGRVLGCLGLFTSDSGRAYDAGDVAFVEDVARRAALAMENADLYARQRDIADTLQRSLLPRALPTPPGLDVAALYLPGQASEIGGDFYDMFPLSARRWGVVIGDVCGKGVEAAAMTAQVRYTLRGVALRSETPSLVLALANGALLEEQSERFCTAVYCDVQVHDDSATVHLACAGHPLPFVLRADGTVESVGSSGTVLGWYSDPHFVDGTVSLASGDSLVLYTDGLTEARMPPDVSGERVMATLLGIGGVSLATDIVARAERFLLAVRDGAMEDDAAMLVVRVSGPASRAS